METIKYVQRGADAYIVYELEEGEFLDLGFKTFTGEAVVCVSYPPCGPDLNVFTDVEDPHYIAFTESLKAMQYHAIYF